MEENKVNIFEQATRKKLLFQTGQGVLTVSDLWDLSLERLKANGRVLFGDLKDQQTEDTGFDDTSKPSKEQQELQLKYDVVKYIYDKKKAEKEAAENAKAIKEHNEKILNLIAQKQEGKLQSMSEDELKALLK